MIMRIIEAYYIGGHLPVLVLGEWSRVDLDSVQASMLVAPHGPHLRSGVPKNPTSNTALRVLKFYDTDENTTPLILIIFKFCPHSLPVES